MRGLSVDGMRNILLMILLHTKNIQLSTHNLNCITTRRGGGIGGGEHPLKFLVSYPKRFNREGD